MDAIRRAGIDLSQTVATDPGVQCLAGPPGALSSIFEENIMKKTLLAAAAMCVLTSGAALAQQQAEGPWLVRVRAVHLQPQVSDSTGLDLTVDNKLIPEVDVSYFFTKNIAAELILTVPQSLTIKAAGAKLGTVDALPPTLLLQYHFDAQGFKPYVGVGLNHTLFSGVNLGAGVDTAKSSTGAAWQLGVDVPLSKSVYFNVDLKKTYIRTDVYASGSNLGTLTVDPWLLGVGVGWRF